MTSSLAGRIGLFRLKTNLYMVYEMNLMGCSKILNYELLFLQLR
jgi:hypothetical protein